MINLSVVSDYNFLGKGLTLYESLMKFNDNFVMHFLCIDEETFEKIKEINKENIVAYRLQDLLDADENLSNLKEDEYKYFCWSLASYFTNYLNRKLCCDITYIDADIYFHQDINLLFEEIGNKEVGIFRHRQYDMRHPNGNGWFNVGVVHFKNTESGRHLLNWWSDAVLHKKYPELATCGDQRYLDAFLALDRTKLFIDGNIGHGAPWQWYLYYFDTYATDGCITWHGKKQKLVFSHFSQFVYSIEEDTYNPCTTHYCFTPADLYKNNEGLKKIYDDYFEQIKKTHEVYKL